MEGCYSEQSDYGIIIENTLGPVEVIGGHFNNWQPVLIQNAENVWLHGNYFDTLQTNYAVRIGENTNNIRLDMNRMNRGRGMVTGGPVQGDQELVRVSSDHVPAH